MLLQGSGSVHVLVMSSGRHVKHGPVVPAAV